jgi:hypothetical protein
MNEYLLLRVLRFNVVSFELGLVSNNDSQLDLRNFCSSNCSIKIDSALNFLWGRDRNLSPLFF